MEPSGSSARSSVASTKRCDVGNHLIPCGLAKGLGAQFPPCNSLGTDGAHFGSVGGVQGGNGRIGSTSSFGGVGSPSSVARVL